MTTTIATLRPTEAVTFDQGKLATLCDRMGPRAESFIAGVLADVETLIDAITRDHAKTADLSHHCFELAHYADSIGMTTVSRAAKAVLDCLARADARTLAACINRLQRLNQPQGNPGWALESATCPTTVA